jgi:hypothetical protein
MTKNLLFDLEFTTNGVISLSQPGFKFLSSTDLGLKELYNEAIDKGLHVRFTTAEVRDRLLS